MANRKETRFRLHATFLNRLSGKELGEDLSLKDLKDVVKRECPNGFRQWLRNTKRVLEYAQFIDSEKVDEHNARHSRHRRVIRRNRRQTT